MAMEVQNKLPVTIQAVTCLTCAICAWVPVSLNVGSVPSLALLKCI